MDYSGMTLNERLFKSGLMDQFDKAVKLRNKSLLVEILKKVNLEQKTAEQTIETIFKNPGKYESVRVNPTRSNDS